MQRQGFTVPLLIGGATTSQTHTAVKIAPGYEHPTIHVKDASRAVGVVQNLVSEGRKVDYAERIAAEYEEVRRKHAGTPLEDEDGHAGEGAGEPDEDRLGAATPRRSPTSSASARSTTTRWRRSGPYIDWTPFFHSWQLKASYPRIFDDPEKGEEARKLFADAQELLDRIIEEKWLTARAVFGLFPASALPNDSFEVYTDESRERGADGAPLPAPAEAEAAWPSRTTPSLDFVAPKETGLEDHIGLFAVTAGLGADEAARRFEEENDVYNAIMVKALADRLAEAFAELMHRRVRTRVLGLRRRREPGHRRPHQGGVQGHQARPRLPCLPGAHREAHPMGAAGRGGERRHLADRELRDDAGCCGQRLLLLPPRVPLLRGLGDRPGSGLRLRRTQGHGRSKRPRSGSPRTWPTTLRNRAATASWQVPQARSKSAG